MSILKNNAVTQAASALLNNSNRTVNSPTNVNMDNSSKRLPPSLEEGRVIKGEIIDLRNQEVTIKLENNETITAPFKEGGELAIGQTVSFLVVTDGENGVALKLLTKELPPALENTLNKALEAAGLPKNIKNLELVRELLANQMSIDKQSIQNMLRQSLLHKDISIGTLVFMEKHQIPITDINAAQLENCRNYEHRIAGEINTISNSLPDLFDKLAENSDLGKLNTFHNRLIGTLLTDAPVFSTELNPMESNSLVLSQEEGKELLSLLKNNPISERIQESLLQGKGNLREIMNLIETNFSLALQEENASMSQLLSKDESSSKPILTQNQFNNPVIDGIKEQYTQMLKDQGKIGAFLTLENREELLLTLKELPLTDSMKKEIHSGEMNSKELLHLIKSYLPLLSETNAKELLSGSIYKSLVKEQLLANWTLSPKTLTDANALPDLYERMDKQLAELIKLTSNINHFNELSLSQNTAAKSTSDMNGLRQNIDFMKTLNELFTYIQLPIRFKEKTIHSDLYVYTNKKELKKNKNNISVLLHLDMDYLGSLDVHVNLNNNQVNSKFYFETKESAEIVKSHIKQLENALNQKGFLFQYEILKREKQTDMIQEFTKKEMPVTSLKRYSFDIRA